eukprot:648114-Pleurochrysis_carterae.AAC.1
MARDRRSDELRKDERDAARERERGRGLLWREGGREERMESRQQFGTIEPGKRCRKVALIEQLTPRLLSTELKKSPLTPHETPRKECIISVHKKMPLQS